MLQSWIGIIPKRPETGRKKDQEEKGDGQILKYWLSDSKKVHPPSLLQLHLHEPAIVLIMS